MASPKSVVRQQMVLFVLTLMVSAIRFTINILDVWSTTFDVVSKHFDTILVPRINAGLAALLVVLSGLLRTHHRRRESSPTLLELFFGACFASLVFVLISSKVPAVLNSSKIEASGNQPLAAPTVTSSSSGYS